MKSKNKELAMDFEIQYTALLALKPLKTIFKPIFFSKDFIPLFSDQIKEYHFPYFICNWLFHLR